MPLKLFCSLLCVVFLLPAQAFPNEQNDLAMLARHYTPALLAQDLNKLHHKPEIYITHLKPGDEQQIIDELNRLTPQRTFKFLQNDSLFTL